MNKNYILVLTIAVTIFLSFNKLKAQSLNAGDIAFIGMNTDATEGYAFITLNDIPSSEKIFFSDRGIISSGAYIVGTEGTYLFTAPSSGIPCGTIVSFSETSPDVYSIAGVTGATMTLQSGSANLGSGDQVYAYQTATGTISSIPSDATFIAGIMCDYDAICVDGTTFWTQSSCVSSTSESIVPPGLTNGTNCISMTPSGPEIDNMRYTGTLTGTINTLRTLINNPANWETNNSPAYNITSTGYASPSVDCSTLSINDFNLNSTLKIYPNPSNDIIKISGLTTTERYSIYNILGNQVFEGKVDNDEKININKLSKGMYFLKINNRKPIKFIKE